MILLNSKQVIDGVLVLNSEEARWVAADLLRAAEESEDHGMYEINIVSLGSPDFNSRIQVRPNLEKALENAARELREASGRTDENLGSPRV